MGDACRRFENPNFIDKSNAINIRHIHIANDETGLSAVELGQGILAVAGERAKPGDGFEDLG